MKFEVEKNQPIPKGRVTGIAATMRKLQVGDSFVIPADELGEHGRKGLYSIAKRVGIKILTRKLNGDIRIWRVEKSNGGKEIANQLLAKHVEKDNLPAVDDELTHTDLPDIA